MIWAIVVVVVVFFYVGGKSFPLSINSNNREKCPLREMENLIKNSFFILNGFYGWQIFQTIEKYQILHDEGFCNVEQQEIACSQFKFGCE